MLTSMTVQFSFSELLCGVSGLLSPSLLIMMFLGVFIGIMFGATPGISANMGIVLFMPMTFGMEPSRAISLLLSVYLGGMSGGLISAILLNIPGTPASIATAFDGYPMAAKGEAGKALGVGILTSFVGGLISFVALMFLSPLLANYALKFGPFEFFSVGIFSIALISSVVGDSVIKGLAASFLGMCLGFIGLGPLTRVPRMTFGLYALDSGIASISLMIGMFAIPELIKFATRSSDEVFQVVEYKRVKGFGISLVEYASHWKNVLRSSFIGIGIGILPGIGGNVSNLLSYIAAKNMSKTPETFGTGNIDGIIASETANNATIGGALVTMMALGIPGSTTTAILMSSLALHGINPGPTLFINHTQLIYTIFAALLISNIMMIVIESFGLNVFTRLITVPKHILLPIVAMMCFVGAYASSSSKFDVLTVAFFGIIGYFLQQSGFTRTPLILGFILAPIVETNLQRALQSFRMSFTPYFTRPISAFFFMVTVIFLFFNARKKMKGSKKGK
jgi:putative tricarboxylic transport membrane protein